MTSRADNVHTGPLASEPPTALVSERLLDALLAAIPDDPTSFKSLCTQVADWIPLLECAGRHGVAGVLHHQLAQLGHDLPLDIRSHADRQRAAEQLWQSHLQARLVEALRALDAKGVRAVALKGPVLAERIYPDPSVRLSVDLDLLVVPSDLDRATAALETIGYLAEEGPLARYCRRHDHDINLYRPGRLLVELHFRLYVGFGIIISAAEFISRALLYRTSMGPVAWVLSPEDEVLYLCIHAAGHCFERLSWLYDIKLLIRSCPDLDWSIVLARARSLEVVEALSFTCEILRRRLHVAIPELNGLTRMRGLRWRLASVIHSATVARPAPRSIVTLGHLAHMAVLSDRPAAAARFLQHHLLRITRRRAQRYFPGVVPEEWSA